MTPANELFTRAPVFAEDRGRLTLADHGALPFTPARTYVLSHIPPGGRRGGHAWRTQHRFVVVITGRALATLVRDGETHARALENGDAVHVPPGAWFELEAETAHLTALVLASGEHDPGDQLDR